MADHVFVREVNKINTFDTGQHAFGFDQAAALAGRQIDLRHIAGDYGFRSEPEQGEEEDDIARRGWQARGDLANLDESRPRGLRAQNPQRGRDQREAGVSHPCVPAAGAQALAGVAVADHQEVRSERHPLPGEQEREDVGGQDDETHEEQEQGEHHAGQEPASGRVAAGRVLE